MKNIKALFIDCDGVLYDKDKLSYHDMAVAAFSKTIAKYGLTPEEVEQKHKEQNKQGIHGLFNVALSLCNKRHIPFHNFAFQMSKNTDYSRIPEDKEMLFLLKKLGKKIPTYIVTDNTWLHLLTILSQLNGKKLKDIYTPLNIIPLTIENSLYEGFFHPKRVGNQFEVLCIQTNQKPENVLVLDDTVAVCEAANNQGLQTIQISGPEHTKIILRSILDARTKTKRSVSIRKTRDRAGR